MRVAVLGGGYAGVVVTKQLERRLSGDVDLVLVDDTGTHLIQHQLHRVIRHPTFGDAIEIPLTDIVDSARVIEETVTAVDTDEQTIHLNGGDELAYDATAICLGAEPAYYGLSSVEDHSFPLKRLDHANQIHDEITGLIDVDEGTVVVGGGGLSGVQTAGEIAQFVSDEDADVAVVLVEKEASIAPRFGSRFQDVIREKLYNLGVDIRTETEITGATEDAITIRDRSDIPADVTVWTGGIRGPPIFGSERPRVRADLALDSSTFVVGDVGTVVDVDGEVAIPAAQSAIQQGKVAARNIERLVEGDPTGFTPRFERYNFDPVGWVVSIGDDAVVTVGGQVLTGSAAKAVKSTVGVGYLATSGAFDDALRVVREEYGWI